MAAAMDARGIIAALRDGKVLSQAEMSWFARGLADGGVTDAQAGAFAMAVLLKGIGEEGRAALTTAFRDSGQVLRWDLPGPVLDKHSTGGVGDCVSLVLAPALAACGAFVPMISGRGLGHTGGTLDKMESIPGVSTALSGSAFRHVVKEAGCAIVSASSDIAPADRRLYAIRDVTGTVESLDLITVSILSKKLAAGLDGLILDVKCGSGAFMKSPADARALAQALVSTANASGCRTTAMLTDMSQPLAPAMGNALEVAASMRVLTGVESGPLLDLTVSLGGALLAQGGLVESAGAGEAMIRGVLADGRAAETFGRMVTLLGGPMRFVENWSRFRPEATVIREVPALRSGVVSAIDGEKLGLAVVALGGGRRVETDRIDPAVGLDGVLRIGEKVVSGQPLACVHAAQEETAARAVQEVQEAIVITEEAPASMPLIIERIDG